MSPINAWMLSKTITKSEAMVDAIVDDPTAITINVPQQSSGCHQSHRFPPTKFGSLQAPSTNQEFASDDKAPSSNQELDSDDDFDALN